VNFSRDSRVITWLVGGLNFQIEHHLFPRVCHIHYPAISRVIETTCVEYGVPYHANRSFAAGLASHYRWLRRMGR
jgi:linoleoyl-CoA desaturase